MTVARPVSRITEWLVRRSQLWGNDWGKQWWKGREGN